MLSVLLIGLSLSMDALAVSVANALTLRDFRPRHGLLMGLYFGFFQALMPLLGSLLGGVVSGYISAVGPYVSFGLLTFIGVKMIWESRRGGEESGMLTLSHRRLLAMAVATSLDALAVGVSFAFSPPTPGILLSCGVIGVVTFAVSLGGALLAARFTGLRADRAELAGGCVLVAIGVKLLLEGIL